MHYPRSIGEFQAWFRTGADCLDYLEWLRWPAGFVCPACGRAEGWRLGDGRVECAGCQVRTSTTAGTIFDRTRTPLTVWFTACWMFASDKGGVSALSLQRDLEIGSYQTCGQVARSCNAPGYPATGLVLPVRHRQRHRRWRRHPGHREELRADRVLDAEALAGRPVHGPPTL